MTDQIDRTNQVQLNDFRRQWANVRQDVLAAVSRVGESGWYILGNEVTKFEQELALLLDRRHAIGCANGLDAIEIGLRALGIQRGDRVLTTPLSAFATTLAIVRAGGVPVFLDVDSFGLMDLELVQEQLERDKSIRFLVPVHLYGHALNLAKLASIKQEFRVNIIEDCCQAIGSKWGDQYVGSVGAASALSFYPTKNLGAFGDGGALLTDEPTLDAACRSLRDYGQSSRYCHSVLGLNSRLDEVHAAVLLDALMPRLEAWTTRRQAIAQTYIDGIQNPSIQVPGKPPGSNSVWHLFPVLVAKEQRQGFREHMHCLEISTAIHYPELISRQSALANVAFESRDPLIRAAAYCEAEVSLPIHPHMTDDDVNRVISASNSWQPT